DSHKFVAQTGLLTGDRNVESSRALPVLPWTMEIFRKLFGDAGILEAMGVRRDLSRQLPSRLSLDRLLDQAGEDLSVDGALINEQEQAWVELNQIALQIAPQLANPDCGR